MIIKIFEYDIHGAHASLIVLIAIILNIIFIILYNIEILKLKPPRELLDSHGYERD